MSRPTALTLAEDPAGCPSNIAQMVWPPFVSFPKNDRSAGWLPEQEPVTGILALYDAERCVALPDDLTPAVAALAGDHAAWNALRSTSRSKQVEAIHSAKGLETPDGRLGKALAAIAASAGGR